ncbi:hypothetical protein L3N51_01910 [Metallosphaera sp. J1]|uniref:hypothetical protein n=1 Tax=Metallosphaera javensis (ex Hofmann et al. 2022) TaxID=99938 RepID=UPI001EE09C46|nr:hypothetical protein [Metallosphaera javensis (ex Hofmann et al. 2022)]MCG3109615.1 hypothetical protein [Metallosphaera javensis (ex Hofmann et al. 2022)]
MEDQLYRRILLSVEELRGSETDRFLKFLAIINSFLEERGEGRLIIVGGFAAEIYSGRSYRTGDVDIIVEGNVEMVRRVLSRISDMGLRVMLPRIREISEKGIDIVSTVYDRMKEPLKLVVDNSYWVYIAPPEEVILTYLEGWKFWKSEEDKMKAVLVYCAQRSSLDQGYLWDESRRRNVEDYLEKIKEYC